MTESGNQLCVLKDTGLSVAVFDPGGRGHALTRELYRSDIVDRLHTNTAAAAMNSENITYFPYQKGSAAEMATLVQEQGVDFVIVGPEAPLTAGAVNMLAGEGIPAFGPVKEHTWLESSKAEAKKFFTRWNIPVPEYRIFDDYSDAQIYIQSRLEPLVVKATGLAAGKGSIVCDDKEQAQDALHALMVDRKFGEAGDTVVIENRLFGIEQSVMIITDGKTALMLPPARDYKQRLDGNKGLNTGGMGSHSPSGNEDIFSEEKVLERIVQPALEGILHETGQPYQGVLYAGLMWVQEGGEWNPYVLEFNIRFGDPETQVVLPRLETPDWGEIFLAAINGKLGEITAQWSKEHYLAVCAVSGAVPKEESKGKGKFPGYPGRYKPDREIVFEGTPEKGYILHAGTRWDSSRNAWVTTGGRVLNAVGCGQNLETARDYAYKTLEGVSFEFMDSRSDIGNPQIEREGVIYQRER